MRNITDIDDKIIKRAQETGETAKILAERMTKEMHQDYKSLGFLAPDIEPKATEHILDMQKLIKKLIEKGFAYYVPGGDVFFSCKKI